MSDVHSILADQHAAPTPGPLRIVRLPRTVDVYGPDADSHAVATFWGPRDGGPSDAEALANARAFAALPSLLQVLTEIRDGLHPKALGRSATDAELVAITRATWALRQAGVLPTPELQESQP